MEKLYVVENDFIDCRLDRWIKKNIGSLPQSLIEKNLRKGIIKVNKKKTKGFYKLKKNDKIVFYNFNFLSKKHDKEKFRYKPSKKDLTFTSSIFVENNENFAVINKPAGISVQSGTKSKKNILDILRDTDEFKGFIPYTVHRIDKETTGILIVAKNRKFAQLFTALFRIRKIHKTYLGVTIGELNKTKGTLEDILFHYEGEKKVKSKAITHYKVIDSNNNYSLLLLNPQTGRKHQIRKQLLIHGNPILGDSKYRITENKRKVKSSLMLHAYKINFSINNVKYNFLANPPDYFMNILKEKYLKSFLK
ncbi:RluA family pseudouridine synthase [Pelagibacteraceae bacterium]|nr:RluA family pseudouridine synthase [Pelagibacteraceae bacterium]